MMATRADVLIVGGGPAGLAAAISATAHAGSVLVLDDNSAPGGQIWRTGIAQTTTEPDPAKAHVLAVFQSSGAKLVSGRRVISAPDCGTLHALDEQSQTVESYRYTKLILATGARERFLPFPGWTLPGVVGAGGLQALVKGGYSVRGKRIIVAGTGPLLLAVAAHLQQDGATILTIAEQAALGRLLPFAIALLSHPAKLIQGARLRAELSGVPYRTGCWPVAAEGSDKLSAVRLACGRKTWTEPCDLLACGFHLVPNSELAVLLGCKLEHDFVAVDQHQQTSMPDVFCAGEPTGIAGIDAALIQGRIAGLAATGQFVEADALRRGREAEAAFGRALNRAFALRSELRSLPRADTIVCRCEDVRYAQLKKQGSWTDAKLQTRCGMGPCQGRICGPAVQTLFGWRNTSIRPPLFPVPLSALCSDLGTVGDASETQPMHAQETL